MAKRKYQTTKAECQKTIKGVCEGCGGELMPIKTVNNSNEPTFWVGCETCRCFRGGVDKRYWKIARHLVKENIIKPYSDSQYDYKDSPERLEYYLDFQTAGLSQTIRYIHKKLKEEFGQ